jgi:hypothetical protein
MTSLNAIGLPTQQLNGSDMGWRPNWLNIANKFLDGLTRGLGQGLGWSVAALLVLWLIKVL